MTPQPSDLLIEAYRPEQFRLHGEAVVERLSAYLEAAQQAAIPVLTSFDPNNLRERFRATLLAGRQPLEGLLDQLILERSRGGPAQ